MVNPDAFITLAKLRSSVTSGWAGSVIDTSTFSVGSTVQSMSPASPSELSTIPPTLSGTITESAKNIIRQSRANASKDEKVEKMVLTVSDCSDEDVSTIQNSRNSQQGNWSVRSFMHEVLRETTKYFPLPLIVELVTKYVLSMVNANGTRARIWSCVRFHKQFGKPISSIELPSEDEDNRDQFDLLYPPAEPPTPTNKASKTHSHVDSKISTSNQKIATSQTIPTHRTHQVHPPQSVKTPTFASPSWFWSEYLRDIKSCGSHGSVKRICTLNYIELWDSISYFMTEAESIRVLFCGLMRHIREQHSLVEEYVQGCEEFYCNTEELAECADLISHLFTRNQQKRNYLLHGVTLWHLRRKFHEHENGIAVPDDPIRYVFQLCWYSNYITVEHIQEWYRWHEIHMNQCIKRRRDEWREAFLDYLGADTVIDRKSEANSTTNTSTAEDDIALLNWQDDSIYEKTKPSDQKSAPSLRSEFSMIPAKGEVEVQADDSKTKARKLTAAERNQDVVDVNDYQRSSEEEDGQLTAAGLDDGEEYDPCDFILSSAAHVDTKELDLIFEQFKSGKAAIVKPPNSTIASSVSTATAPMTDTNIAKTAELQIPLASMIENVPKVNLPVHLPLNLITTTQVWLFLPFWSAQSKVDSGHRIGTVSVAAGESVPIATPPVYQGVGFISADQFSRIFSAHSDSKVPDIEDSKSTEPQKENLVVEDLVATAVKGLEDLTAKCSGNRSTRIKRKCPEQIRSVIVVPVSDTTTDAPAENELLLVGADDPCVVTGQAVGGLSEDQEEYRGEYRDDFARERYDNDATESDDEPETDTVESGHKMSDDPSTPLKEDENEEDEDPGLSPAERK